MDWHPNNICLQGLFSKRSMKKACCSLAIEMCHVSCIEMSHVSDQDVRIISRFAGVAAIQDLLCRPMQPCIMPVSAIPGVQCKQSQLTAFSSGLPWARSLVPPVWLGRSGGGTLGTGAWSRSCSSSWRGGSCDRYTGRSLSTRRCTGTCPCERPRL